MKDKNSEMKKEPRVAIITPTFSQDKLLERNLKSLKKMNYLNWRLYLIDDASESEIGKKMKKKFPWINLIINKKNQGFAISNNKGFKKAIKEFNPDYFLMWNDDCEVYEKDWLNKLINFAEEKKSGGLFGVQVIYQDKSLQWFSKKRKTNLFKIPGKFSKNKDIEKVQKIDNIIGACILIKKEVFNKIGFLDEKFSPFYGEETDFCFRAKKAGFKIFYIGNIKIIHHGNKSISKLTKEEVWYIQKRNSFRLERKHYGFFKRSYYAGIHFLSIFKNDGLDFWKKIKLITKAYSKSK
jgi:GT2 family glycosyltransferase